MEPFWCYDTVACKEAHDRTERPMISINRRVLNGEVYNDVRCLSTDEKPIEGIRNGSTLIEIDTGEKYMFDANEMEWNSVGDAFSIGTFGVTI